MRNERFQRLRNHLSVSEQKWSHLKSVEKIYNVLSNEQTQANHVQQITNKRFLLEIEDYLLLIEANPPKSLEEGRELWSSKQMKIWNYMMADYKFKMIRGTSFYFFFCTYVIALVCTALIITTTTSGWWITALLPIWFIFNQTSKFITASKQNKDIGFNH